MGKYKEYVCQICGQTFQSNKGCKTRTPKYCSRKCAGLANAKMKTCAFCGKEFYDWTKEKYCSKACANEAQKGVPLSAEHRKKLSEARKNSPRCHDSNLYNWKGGKETYHARMKVHAQRRRSKQKLPIDARYMRIVRKAQCNSCFYCGCDMGDSPSLEHLTPVSRGGDNQRWNLVYACKSCNSRKHDKTLEEYAVKIGSFYLVDKYDVLIARIYTPYMELIKKEKKYEKRKNKGASR